MMAEADRTPPQPSMIPPEKAKTVLILILVLINAAFFIMILNYRNPEERIEEVRQAIAESRSAYEIEMPLIRHILLKMEIQKDLREGTEPAAVITKIDAAVAQLEALLANPALGDALEEYKITNIRLELDDMRSMRSTLITGQPYKE